jgi:hypothetical protein
MMQKLRRIHLYLGCVFAPTLVFFAVTGAWQLFTLHERQKNSSYVPPRIVHSLSEIHVHQRTGDAAGQSKPLKFFFLTAAAGLVATTVLGVVMAFRLLKNPWVVIACLGLGIALPTAMLVLT